MPQPPGIFICYRRADAGGHPAHLHRHLRAHFGEAAPIFMDTADIGAGVQFERKLESELTSCEVFLALISRRWLTIRGGPRWWRWRRRLNNPKDYVRREIATALKRDIIVIPVLLDGAQMPSAHVLTRDISRLASYQGFKLRNRGWLEDADRLVSHIERQTEELRERRRRSEEQREARRAESPVADRGRPPMEWGWAELAVGVLSISLLLGLVIWYFVRTVPISKIWIDIVEIPAGTYVMGSAGGHDNELPMTPVTFREPFFVGKYEVTQREWKEMMGEDNNPSTHKGDDLPVENITWEQAKTFVGKLNEMQNPFRYSLPTEAEWEYVCKLGNFGKDDAQILIDRAWYGRDPGAQQHTHSPARAFAEGKKADELGLYYMHGNVWEWCWDVYHPNYDGLPSDGSGRGGERESHPRVLRGGAFNVDEDNCRCSFRKGQAGNITDGSVGLRVVARPRPILKSL